MRKMLTKEKCKTLLEKKENKYTNEEVTLIVDFLNQIIEAQLSLNNFKNNQNEKSCLNGASVK